MGKTPKRTAGMMAHVARQPGAHPVFKTVCIKDSSPEAFARKHEQALNELVSDGWNVTGMIEKGGSLLITAVRQEIGDPVVAVEKEEGQQTFLPPSSTNMEITYTFIERGKVNSVRCVSMVDVMNRVREHLNTVSEEIVPFQITVLSATTYEPLENFKVLDRLYPGG